VVAGAAVVACGGVSAGAAAGASAGEFEGAAGVEPGLESDCGPAGATQLTPNAISAIPKPRFRQEGREAWTMWRTDMHEARPKIKQPHADPRCCGVGTLRSHTS